MKKILFIGIGFLFLLWSCEEKFESGDFIPSDIEYSDSLNLPPLTDIGKRGIYLLAASNDWSSRVSSVKPHWHYSDKVKRSFKEPGNIDFVPMIADTGDLDTDNYEYLFGLKDEGLLLNILSFNEPDDTASNLSVAEAVNAWPELEQFDIPLGSPLCLDISGTWINDFMTQAASNGLRVDYIVMQWYGPADAEAFLNTVDSVYNAFNKPVWIARFAPVNARLSEVKTFIETVIPELESRDHVFRYAWDPGELNTPTAFWDADGNLTPRGEYYAGYEPNYFVSLGRDDWIDFDALENIVSNGDFESGSLEPFWGGWGKAIVSGEEAFEGNYAGKSERLGWADGTALAYPSLEVEPANTYYYSFVARLSTPITDDWNGCTMLARNQTGGEVVRFHFSDPINTTEWKTYTGQFYVPEGFTEVRFTWWKKKNAPAVLVDNFFVAKIE